MRSLFVAVLAVSFLAGCANGFKQFYTPFPGATPELIAAERVSPPPATPFVERSQPAPADQVLAAYARRGYSPVGSSMFNGGGQVSEEQAVAQGRDVGADLVLIFNPRYTGTVTSTVPITTPTSSTTYSSGTATAYGPGGPVTAYGTGTATTYGTTTTYVPISVNRSDYGAVYFVKRKQHFGAFWRNLNDSERQQMQTNKGVVITLVVDGAPAYAADILVGDIITQVNGEPVTSQEALNQYLRARRGQAVLVDLVRNGNKLQKTVNTAP
jgi:hypothetical protein